METKITVKNYLRSNVIVHMALILGQVFFILTSFVITSQGAIASELHSTFLYLIPAIVLIAFLVSNFIYRRKIARLRNAATISGKLEGFRLSMIIRSAVLEGAGFTSIIALMMTGELLYAGLSLLIVFYMLTFIPTKQRMINDLELSTQEEAFVNNPDNEVEGVNVNRGF